MIVRLNVRHCDWTCGARTILRSIVRMLVRFIGGIYISTVFSQKKLKRWNVGVGSDERQDRIFM